MRALIVLLLAIVGCADLQPIEESNPECSNITREFSASVPFAFDVMDDEETILMANGCTLTTITHYVLETSGFNGAGGSAPDPLHCDADGCGPVPWNNKGYVDPAPVQNLHIASDQFDMHTKQ